MTKYSSTSSANFTAYFTARGVDVSAYNDTSIDAALLVASEWIDRIYGSLFIGMKTDGYTQTREWPRENAVIQKIPSYIFADNEIPDQITNAVYEAAYRQLVNPGCLSLDYTPNKYNRVSIHGATSVDYKNINFASEIQSTFPIIEQLLSDLFLPENSGVSSIYSSTASRV